MIRYVALPHYSLLVQCEPYIIYKAVFLCSGSCGLTAVVKDQYLDFHWHGLNSWLVQTSHRPDSNFILPLCRVLRHGSWMYLHWWLGPFGSPWDPSCTLPMALYIHGFWCLAVIARKLQLLLESSLLQRIDSVVEVEYGVGTLKTLPKVKPVIVEGCEVPSCPPLLYAELVQWLQDWTWAKRLIVCCKMQSTAKQMEVCDSQTSILVGKCLKRAVLLVEDFLHQVSGHRALVHYVSSIPGCSEGE